MFLDAMSSYNKTLVFLIFLSSSFFPLVPNCPEGNCVNISVTHFPSFFNFPDFRKKKISRLISDNYSTFLISKLKSPKKTGNNVKR